MEGYYIHHVTIRLEKFGHPGFIPFAKVGGGIGACVIAELINFWSDEFYGWIYFFHCFGKCTPFLIEKVYIIRLPLIFQLRVIERRLITNVPVVDIVFFHDVGVAHHLGGLFRRSTEQSHAEESHGTHFIGKVHELIDLLWCHIVVISPRAGWKTQNFYTQIVCLWQHIKGDDKPWSIVGTIDQR